MAKPTYCENCTCAKCARLRAKMTPERTQAEIDADVDAAWRASKGVKVANPFYGFTINPMAGDQMGQGGNE